MRLIKVKIHIEENVNGNKNNPEPDSHTFEPHILYPPGGEEQGHFSYQHQCLLPADGEEEVGSGAFRSPHRVASLLLRQI